MKVLLDTHVWVWWLTRSGRLTRAERAAFKGDYAKARSLYRDALFYLGRDNIHNEDREQAAAFINTEIEKLQSLENENS